MEIVKVRPGLKIKGNIESLTTLSLLREFLGEEEIWGYEYPRPKSINIVWNKNWETLLKLVADSFKRKIVNIHPDVNDSEKELATHLITIFNILKTRIKKKIYPETISEKINKSYKYKELKKIPKKEVKEKKIKIILYKKCICDCKRDFQTFSKRQKFYSKDCHNNYYTQLSSNIYNRFCKCGCNNSFITNIKNKYFFSKKCRKNFFNRKYRNEKTNIFK